jgi:hypothetical protein
LTPPAGARPLQHPQPESDTGAKQRDRQCGSEDARERRGIVGQGYDRWVIGIDLGKNSYT